MPSFRTIFLVAATAFAALASASPENSSTSIDQTHDVIPVAVALSKVGSDNSVTVIDGSDKGHHDEGKHHEPTPERHGDRLLPNRLDSRDTPSLCEILAGVSAKLEVVTGKIKAQDTPAKPDGSPARPDINVIVQLTDSVRVIIADALVQGRGLKGRSLEEILAYNGRTATRVELCELLLKVVNAVAVILSIAFRLAGVASIKVIAAIDVVFAEFLCLNFHLVEGVYALIHPSFGNARDIFVSLKLDAVVRVIDTGRF
ncbi:hypothetical protein H0H81_001434 [Sphagnurus paluster]|uniref:Uncharacterized protein n=1 Tax=Sphagnurus paluster TaxID=117069 RepID=A0A9P7FML7_9AGAR|nr:hypothetical protein H0H81_001434 [Sphagnurus paluster]